MKRRIKERSAASARGNPKRLIVPLSVPQKLAGMTLPKTSTFIADRSPRSPASKERSATMAANQRSEEHTSELQSLAYLVCRLLLEKKKHAVGHVVVHDGA